MSPGPDSKGIDTSVQRWDNDKRGEYYMIPYTFDYLPYPDAQQAALDGMRMLEEGTCLRFHRRTNEADFLQFYYGELINFNCIHILH